MKIPLTINGTKKILTSEPDEKLLNVLRKEKLYSVKCGCEEGICGNCTVLLDGKPVPSCILSIGLLRDSKIITLEYLKTLPEYQDIMTGFSQAKINLCSYCNAGKIFIVYQIIKGKKRPSLEQINYAIKDLNSCCTDTTALTNGILHAWAIKTNREGKKQNVTK